LNYLNVRFPNYYVLQVKLKLGPKSSLPRWSCIQSTFSLLAMICMHNVLEKFIFVFSLDSRTPELKKITVRYQKIQINHFALYSCVESLLTIYWPMILMAPCIIGANALHNCQITLCNNNKYHIQSRLKCPCSMTKLTRFYYSKNEWIVHPSQSIPYLLYLNRGIFLPFSTLLHLASHRFNYVGGCLDRTQDCCDLGIGSIFIEHKV
jgi:hypothetical protein